MSFDSLLNTIIGKNLVGAVSKEDLDAFWPLVSRIVEYLDITDEEDLFGTEGWRHTILGED